MAKTSMCIAYDSSGRDVIVRHFDRQETVSDNGTIDIKDVIEDPCNLPIGCCWILPENNRLSRVEHLPLNKDQFQIKDGYMIFPPCYRKKDVLFTIRYT